MSELSEIEELRRSVELRRALDGASAAMAEVLTEDEIFAAAGAGLQPFEMETAILLLDDARENLHLVYLSPQGGVLGRAEKLLGINRESFTISRDRTQFHRAVLNHQQTVFVDDAATLTAQVLPAAVRPLTKALLKLLSFTQVIGSPLIVDGDVRGLLTVSSDRLDKSDVEVIRMFARQVAGAMRKAAMVRRLEVSMEQLRGAQAQLLQAQKMEALGLLAGGVAHDLNNVLTAVGMSSHLLRQEVPDAFSEELDCIDDGVACGAKLLRQLLHFSHRGPVDARSLDARQLLTTIGGLLRNLLSEGVTLDVRGGRRALWVEVETALVEQVLMNLVLNAKDALPGGGVIRVEGQIVPGPARPEEDAPKHVALSVSDNGTGIPPEALPKIFDPFFTTKRAGLGTGLGLSLSYGIVEQHKGRIHVETEPGEGTTFTVHLPLAKRGKAGNDAQAPARPRNLRGDGERVLIVEDEPKVLHTTRRCLTRLGYEVVAAASIAEARELEVEGLDVALIDIRLPDGLGTELSSELHAQRPELPVVFTSGYFDDSGVQDVRDRGRRFLWKPYAAADLLVALHEAMNPHDA